MHSWGLFSNDSISSKNSDCPQVGAEHNKSVDSSSLCIMQFVCVAVLCVFSSPITNIVIASVSPLWPCQVVKTCVPATASQRGIAMLSWAALVLLGSGAERGQPVMGQLLSCADVVLRGGLERKHCL